MKERLETEKKGNKVIEKITGSEAIVRCLIKEGTEVLFGYPGGAIMPTYDALFDYENELKHILVRHEQGATHAAQGYARTTGKVGVCIATSGPGATNLITGIADAMIDSTPMVCITGQVGSNLLGTDAFQETDVVGISMPVTKWNVQVIKAVDIPDVLARAFYIAKTGRPGPVLVDITKDAQFELLEWRYEKCNGFRSYRPMPKQNNAKIKEAVELFNQAKKPLVLVGQGITLSGAEKELETFLNQTGMPAACTLLGLSALKQNHPQYTGMLGMHGNYAPNKLTNEADLIFAVGMRFDDRVTGDLSRYAIKAKVVHLDIDPAEIDKNVPTDVALIGDAKATLKEINKLVNKNKHDNWLNKFNTLRTEEYKAVIENDLFPKEIQISMGEVVHKLSDLQNDCIVVTDVGQHQMITSRYFEFKQKRSYITSGGLGTMGFALPAAMGAQIGAPNKTIVAIIGDGGFQMTIQELGTIAQQKLPVKIVVLNNEFLGMVRQWQELFFNKRYAQTKMHNPDFIQIAKGYGIKGKQVSKREDLSISLTTMLQHDGPFILEVKVKKENNIFPMITTGASVDEIRLN